MAVVKVKLIKDHNGRKKGTTGNVAKARADYLVRMGVAEYVVNKPTEVKPKVEEVKTEAKPKVSKPKSTNSTKQVKKVEEDKPCKTC